MLDMFFNPQSVAIVGASENPQKLGHQVLANVIYSGFKGPIYPINPKASEILGLKCYASLLDIPGPVELVTILVPNKAVAGVMEEAGQKGAKGAIIITAGFREAGGEGVQMEQQLLDIAKKYGMRIVGPNCLGLIDTFAPINASFAAGMPEQGSIAFMSQSGALCTAILDYALAENIGFSHFISLGNKSDIDEVALLDAWQDDPRTNVVIAYIEGIKDGPRFMTSARRAARNKPIIAVKSGRTASGSKAVSSHTGSLAGSDAAYDAAFKQTGVLRAESVQELFDYSIAFSYQPLIKGNRVAFVTNAGGPGVMATDALERNGLVLAGPDPRDGAGPGQGSAAQCQHPQPHRRDRRRPCRPLSRRHRSGAQGSGRGWRGGDPHAADIDGYRGHRAGACSRPARIAASRCWGAGWARKKRLVASRCLALNRVPNYPFPERAVAALGAMYRYIAWRQQPESEVAALCGGQGCGGEPV